MDNLAVLSTKSEDILYSSYEDLLKENELLRQEIREARKAAEITADLVVKIDENDQGGDDNPDIDHYLGNWEFQAYLPVAEYFDLSLLLRKWVRSEGPSYQLDLDYFLRNNIYTRIQVVHGYGESLIDYNRKVSKIGLGFAFSAHEARDTRHRIQ